VDEDKRESWARFRFEVIAPLLDETLDGAEKARIRSDILARMYTSPDGKRWRLAERTLRHWLRRYRQGQLRELENRRNKTRGQMKALDESVLVAAKGLRERMRSRSIQDILMHLKFTSGVDISTISPSTLNRHLKRIGATKDKSYSERGSFQLFQKEHINQTWQSDCTDGILVPDPLGLKELRQTTLITFIDDASRFCVHGEFYWTQCLVDLLDCFRTALTARGKPSEIYTDNGSIYRARDLAHICTSLGVGLKHSQEYQPEGKGKQERHYLTIKMRFYKEAKKAGIATLADLNEFFWAWLDQCYHNVKHTSLGMTPLERWQMEESRITRLSLERLHEAMQLRCRRTVDTKTALIRVNGKRYQAGRNLAGQRVQIRWPFDDQSAVNIWREGDFYERAELFTPLQDIDYSKRPDRRGKDEEPKVLDCSKQLRAALVSKYRGEKAPEDTSRWGVLTEREFTFVVGQCLGRTLTEAESAVLSQTYKTLFPIDAEFVQRCLTKAIGNKGNGKHISFYAKWMQELRHSGGK